MGGNIIPLVIYLIGCFVTFYIIERRCKNEDNLDYSILSIFSSLSWLGVGLIGLGLLCVKMSGKNGK